MLFLLLDTADVRGCVALFRDTNLLALNPHSGEEDYSSWLLPAVQAVLTGQALSLADLDGYAVCSGPGSFTGLRVGLTTVKAWAEIYQKPIAAVSRLEALARTEDPLQVPNLPFTAVFADARRGQVFAALYGDSTAPIEPEAVIALEIFLSKAGTACGTARVLWKSPDPQLLQSLPGWPARKANGDILQPIEPPFATQLGALARQKFLHGQSTDAISLDANYIRRSDAELFWKDQASLVKA